VQLFGPAMYQRNPDRSVAPRKSYIPPMEYFGDPNDPYTQQAFLQFQMMAQQERVRDKVRADLFQTYLNYTPQETGLRDEFRLAVDESLIKGMTTLWTEVSVMPSGLQVVGSYFDSIDNLILDPDAKRLEECMWIARRCVHPTWEVEREYGYAPGSIRGNIESVGHLAGTQGDAAENYRRALGSSSDLLCYWKVWSKMGVGGRLKNVMDGMPDYRRVLDESGDYCFLALCDNLPHPLNVPKEVLDSADPQAIAQATQWPIPFWLDRGGWPMTPIIFHPVPNRLWPMAHLKPALGELKFINWVYSFLTGKIRTACRDILVMAKSMADEAKKAIKHGPDYSVIEMEQIHMDIDKVVKFIQHPGFNAEIYRVLEHMIELFDKRTGLTEIVYGESANQLRSAAEANVKQANASIRPDDMAQTVEDAATVVARKEMAAARWVLGPDDVMPVLGSFGAFLWQQEVMSTKPEELFHSFECRVEAGSTKRPNKQREAESLNNAMNNLFPSLYSYAQATGDVKPVNALMGDWTGSIGLDGEKYLLHPLPPPQAPAGPPGGPSPAPQPA
jgi:hypothetical protein